MDIIYKFGEQYYQESENSFLLQILMSFIGAFFGFGFALILYYFQNKKVKNKQSLERTQVHKDQLEYFKILLSGSLTFVEKQLDLLKEYISEQEELLDQKIYKESANNDINRLMSLDLHSIFLAYREIFGANKSWIKEYSGFYHSLDFVDGKLLEVRRIYKNNLDQGWDDILNVKALVDQLPNQLSKYALRISNNLGEERWKNDAYIFLDSQIIKYREIVSKGADLETIGKDYLKPMIKEILDNHDKEEFAEEIMTTCKNARVKMNDIKGHMRDMLDLFKTVPESLKTSIKNMEKMKLKLETSYNNG